MKRTHGRALIAFITVVAAAIVIAVIAFDREPGDPSTVVAHQYGHTDPPRTTTTTPTTTSGTTTSGTTTSGTTTSGTTTSGTTTKGRKKPPKTKIKVRSKVRQNRCKNNRSGRNKKCSRSARDRAGGRNRRGTPNIKVNGRRATVHFEAEPNEPGTTFQCRMNGGAWKTCSSPYKSPRLKRGSNKFDVRAVGPDGEVDPTPASDRIKFKGKRRR